MYYLWICVVVVKHTPFVCRRINAVIRFAAVYDLACCIKKRKPDRNPASFKIQYPMKNRGKYAAINLNKKLSGHLFVQNVKKPIK
jgi:hypothetical protein